MAATVLDYSIDTFAQLLEDHSDASPSIINNKLSSNYFRDYFDAVGVKTILVESPYIDHDYLDDFSAFYVKCFHPYKRFCSRLHFFGEKFDSASFSEYLQGRSSALGELLERSYRGFLVVRPLPRSIIGRTCLVNYDSDGGRRHFPTGIPCQANLFGLPLSVTTVPFQEQDTVTAACATSALWAAFQVTGAIHRHWLPSPVEITSSATQHMPLRSRVFPNVDGLTIEQMARAIHSVGLEPYYIDASSENILKSSVYAYVSNGIPAVLVFRLTHEEGSKRKTIGYHAATVTGFSIPNSVVTARPDQTSFRSDRIDKLYTHDDQVGPHARMEFMVPSSRKCKMRTSWGLGAGYVNVRAIPDALLFPLYNKIRLPYSVPMQDIITFDGVWQSVVNSVATTNLPRLEWDLRLLTVDKLRRDIKNWADLTARDREQFLTKSLPRFMWQATAWDGANRQIDMIFDATDIDSGDYIRMIQLHDPMTEAIVDTIKGTPSNLSDSINSIYNKINIEGT